MFSFVPDRGFRSGRRAVCLCVAAVAAALLPGSALGQTEFPVASRGDIWFQADHAGFLGTDGGAVEEYYFRITNNQLTFREWDEDRLQGRVFVKLKFKDEEGNGLGEAKHRYEFTVPNVEIAESPSHAQLLLFREPLDPRTRLVEVEVEDLNARKRGLLYMVTGKRKNGKAEGFLHPPGFLGSEFGLSDIQFAWEIRTRTAESSFAKNGFDVIPNPGRSYGLLQPRLSAYFEVYDSRDSTGTDYTVRHEIVNPAGEVVGTSIDTVSSRGEQWVDIVTFDVSKMGTGEYRLRGIVADLDGGEERVTERPFSILWKSRFWAQTEEDMLNEAKVLLLEDEYDKFKQMSTGDRELFLEQFWSEQDPTPNSAVNELRAEFMRRVEYANRHYSTLGKGMLSDRGRIYIRFGPPDEVTRELLPTADSQLDRQLDEFKDDQQATGDLLATNDGFDTRSYEVWSYTRQGTPLFPEREEMTTVTGLEFVFVDETGTGHYVLRHSSDFIGY